MRRPILPWGFALSAGIVTADFFRPDFYVGVILCALVLIGALFLKDGFHYAGVVLCFFLAGILLVSWEVSYEKGIEYLPDRTLVGTVKEIREKAPDNHSLVVKCDELKVMVRCYSDLPDGRLLVGMKVRVKGDLEKPQPATNPDCFDYRMYLRSRNIYATMTTNGVEVLGEGSRFYRRLAVLRNDFEKVIKANTKEDQAGIIVAMLFGDKAGLDEDDYDSFQRNGTAHVLAVSGLHIGMVYGLFVMLIGGKRRISINILICLFLIIYAAMAGFSPSVMRAVIMIILHIAARLSHRRYDLISAACFAAIVLMVLNPYAIFGVGFQLSFLAIFLLGHFAGLLGRLALPGAVTGVLLPLIILQPGMAMMIAYEFNYVSFGALLGNIPVTFLTGIIVPGGIIAMMVCQVLPAGGETIAGGLGVVSEMLSKVNEITYMKGGLTLDVVSPPVLLVVLFYGGLFFVFSEWSIVHISRKDFRPWKSAGAVVLAISLIFGWCYRNEFKDAECVFVDVGQGSCIHLRTPGGSDLLFDGGGKRSFGATKEEQEKNEYDIGKKVLKPYLLKNGTSEVELAMVTHLDADHYKGIASLCRLGMVRKLGLHESLRGEEGRVLRETKMKKRDIKYFSTGEVLRVDGFELKVLGPISEEEKTGATGLTTESNENSMVAKVTFANESFFDKGRPVSVLITGDIDEGTEAGLVAKYGSRKGGLLDSDVLAVPHHGSRYSSSPGFIKAVSPGAAVIQVGKNTYGHPSPEVIERYEKAGIKVFRNDTRGAVGVCGGKVKVMQRIITTRPLVEKFRKKSTGK